jgi:hypothetical protein
LISGYIEAFGIESQPSVHVFSVWRFVSGDDVG